MFGWPYEDPARSIQAKIWQHSHLPKNDIYLDSINTAIIAEETKSYIYVQSFLISDYTPRLLTMLYTWACNRGTIAGRGMCVWASLKLLPLIQTDQKTM